MKNFCECGCGQLVKPKKRFIRGHSLIRWKKEYPEEYQIHQRKMGELTHKLYPNMASKIGKKVHQMYPNLASENAKKSHKERKKHDPIGYKQQQIKAGKIGILKGGGWKKIHQLYPDFAKENALKMHREWQERDPEGHKAFLISAGRKGGTTTQHRYPTLPSETLKKTLQKWRKEDPNGFLAHVHEASEKAKIVNIDWDFYIKYGCFKHQYPYCNIWTENFRENIRKRDDYRCIVTGMTNEEHRERYGKSLVVHHWTYNKDEIDPFYFATVSIPINIMAQRNRDQWIDLFNGIMEDKYCEMLKI